MQRYHFDCEDLPDYINELKDAQDKAERENSPITNAALFIIATNVMLSTEQLTWVNKGWEELDVSQRTWARWKTTYCAAAKKLTIKRKATSGKDQFGSV